MKKLLLPLLMALSIFCSAQTKMATLTVNLNSTFTDSPVSYESGIDAATYTPELVYVSLAKNDTVAGNSAINMKLNGTSIFTLDIGSYPIVSSVSQYHAKLGDGVIGMTGNITLSNTVKTTNSCLVLVEVYGTKQSRPFNYLTLPGVKMLAMTDAGVTLNGSNISAINNAATSNNLTQSNSSYQPAYVDTLCVPDGTNDYLTFSDINDIRTVIMVVGEDPGATSNYRPILGHSSSYNFARGNYKLIFDGSAASSYVLGGTLKLNGVTINGSTTVMPSKLSILTLTTTGNVSANNWANDRINYGRVWDGEQAFLFVSNQVLGATDLTNTINALKEKYRIQTNTITFAGNSYFDTQLIQGKVRDGLITEGNNSSFTYAAHDGSGIGNSASAGSNYMLNSTRLAQVEAGLYENAVNLVEISEVINDLYYYTYDGSSAQAAVSLVYNNIVNYINTIDAYAATHDNMAVKYIINTATPRNNTGTSVNYELARQDSANKSNTSTLNGLLRSHFPVTTTATRVYKSTETQFINTILVDPGDDPNIGQKNACNNTTYFDADKVHLNATGQAIYKQYYVDATLIWLGN